MNEPIQLRRPRYVHHFLEPVHPNLLCLLRLFFLLPQSLHLPQPLLRLFQPSLGPLHANPECAEVLQGRFPLLHQSVLNRLHPPQPPVLVHNNLRQFLLPSPRIERIGDPLRKRQLLFVIFLGQHHRPPR
jgi:hypothetical protein